MPPVLFMGSIDEMGMHWYRPTESGRHLHIWDDDPLLAGCPWRDQPHGIGIDAKLAPTTAHPTEGNPFPLTYRRQTAYECAQGLAALRIHNGWTALSFWDRSGKDRRGAINSNFVTHDSVRDFAEMCRRSQLAWPRIWERFPFAVTLHSVVET